jgi:iron complex outermembrane receptor protein
VSRATRLPARYELDIIARVANLPPSPESMGLPLVVTLNGNRGIKPESVLAVESGYRIQLSNRISLDATGFSNRYSRLSVLSRQPQRVITTAAPYIELPLMPTNSGQGWSHGLELSLSARLHKRWKLQGSYTGWRFDLFLSGQQQSGSDGISADPTHQAKIQSWLDLPGRLQLDALFFAASSLPARAGLIGPLPRVPALGRLDLRLGWQANKKLHLSLHLQNGLDSRRLEYLSIRSSHFHDVRRGLFGKVAWTF